MTQPSSAKLIDLELLATGIDGLSPRSGGGLAEACAVCMEDRGHSSGVDLKVIGSWKTSFQLKWVAVTDQPRRSWNDLPYSAEQGGYGLAILLMRKLAGLGVVERSKKGPGFDYWLGEKDAQPFQKKARLEVHGTLQSNASQVEYKTKVKLKQTDRSDGTFPAYVVVVEYSAPLSNVVKK